MARKVKKTEDTRAIAYIRVSTDKQAEKGLSLEAQRAKIEAYAALYEIELIDVIEEAASAKTLDRPKLRSALERVDAGEANAIIVVKLDRLTRSVRDIGELVERYFADGAIALLSVSEQIDTRSAAGRLVLNVLSSVSQWEREAIGERTAAAMQHHSATGGYVGGRAPYGYRPGHDGQLEANPAEQSTITTARALRSGRSLRAVASELASRGLLDRQGKVFTAVALRRILGEDSSRVFSMPTATA